MAHPVLTPCKPDDIQDLRVRFLEGGACQIVRSSFVTRGLADVFTISKDELTVGYIAVATKYYSGRIIEIYVAPETVLSEDDLDVVIRQTGASSIEAQSNMPYMYTTLQSVTRTTTVENYLFGEWSDPQLKLDGTTWQLVDESVAGNSVWTLRVNSETVGTGEILGHYNPPYVDIVMEVIPDARQKGYGACIVQQLCRECLDRGLIPSARCDESNDASRATLERGGFKEIGRIESGTIR